MTKCKGVEFIAANTDQRSRAIMQNKGLALMDIGYGEGKERALNAGRNAISSPCLTVF
jgi:cell division GTPase FtsZ